MLATVAGDPPIGTVPLFTSRLPAASRDTVMALGFSSPSTLSTPPEAVAVTAHKRRASSGSTRLRTARWIAAVVLRAGCRGDDELWVQLARYIKRPFSGWRVKSARRGDVRP